MAAAMTSDRHRHRHRHRPARYGAAVTAALVLVVSLVAPVPAVHAATAPQGRVVLDPDDNYSHAQWGGASYTELPITYAIAQAAKAKLEALCDTSVVITRDASQDFVPRAQRAALMTNADVSLTISLNAFNGFAVGYRRGWWRAGVGQPICQQSRVRAEESG